MSEVIKTAVPLPATVEEMLSRRTMPDRRTLNDHVDDIHQALWGTSEQYRQLLDAVYDEDAVEGSLAIDNHLAAKVIRDWAAKDARNPYVAGKKLATLVKSLTVVLRRYHMTRKERAVTVAGEAVSTAE